MLAVMDLCSVKRLECSHRNVTVLGRSAADSVLQLKLEGLVANMSCDLSLGSVRHEWLLGVMWADEWDVNLPSLARSR